MADITPRKRSSTVTRSERWNYAQTTIANCKRYAKM